MIYPRELGKVLDVSQFFCAHSRIRLRQLAKSARPDYNKAIRCPTEKGQKQAVFGGNDHGVTFTGSPHISARE